MGAFAAGQVVIVHFPFSDLTASKLRPAVLLAEAGRALHPFCRRPGDLNALRDRLLAQPAAAVANPA